MKGIKERCDNFINTMVPYSAGESQIKDTMFAFYAGASAAMIEQRVLTKSDLCVTEKLKMMQEFEIDVAKTFVDFSATYTIS